MLDAGANVNAVDPGGETPLLIAEFYDRNEVLELLLARGTNPDARGFGGYAALMNAASIGDDVQVQSLVRHGARVNLRGKNGATALAMALKDARTATKGDRGDGWHFDYPAVIRLLKAAGATE